MKSAAFFLIFTILCVLTLSAQSPPSYYNKGWNQITGSSQVNAISNLNNILEHLDLPIPTVKKVRFRNLPFYENGKIYEYEAIYNDTLRLYNTLNVGDQSKLLIGNSDVIHSANKTNKLLLDTDEQIIDYLKFFVSSLNTSEGRFLLVTNEIDYENQFHKSFDLYELRNKIFSPSVLSKSEEFKLIKVAMLYEGQLFEVKLELKSNGNLNMKEDKPLTNKLPMLISYFDKYGAISLKENLQYLELELNSIDSEINKKQAIISFLEKGKFHFDISLQNKSNLYIHSFSAMILDPAARKKYYTDEFFFNVGNLEEGKVYEFKILIENESDTPISIVNNPSSCGCIISSFPPVIDPQSFSEGVVKYNTLGRMGQFAKGIDLQTLGKNNQKIAYSLLFVGIVN